MISTKKKQKAKTCIQGLQWTHYGGTMRYHSLSVDSGCHFSYLETCLVSLLTLTAFCQLVSVLKNSWHFATINLQPAPLGEKKPHPFFFCQNLYRYINHVQSLIHSYVHHLKLIKCAIKLEGSAGPYVCFPIEHCTSSNFITLNISLYWWGGASSEKYFQLTNTYLKSFQAVGKKSLL